MTTQRRQTDLASTEAVPEADAVEQQADVLEVTPVIDDDVEGPGAGAVEPADGVRLNPDLWDVDAIDPDDERVVALDDDDYR